MYFRPFARERKDIWATSSLFKWKQIRTWLSCYVQNIYATLCWCWLKSLPSSTCLNVRKIIHLTLPPLPSSSTVKPTDLDGIYIAYNNEIDLTWWQCHITRNIAMPGRKCECEWERWEDVMRSYDTRVQFAVMGKTFIYVNCIVKRDLFLMV